MTSALPLAAFLAGCLPAAGVMWTMLMYRRRRRGGRHTGVDEEQVQALLARSPRPTTVSDLTGALILSNDAWRTLIGGDPNGLPDDSVRHHLNPQHVPTYNARVREMIGGKRTQLAMEGIYLRADGTEAPCNLTGYLLTNPRGAPVYCVTVLEDTSEERRAEDHLRENEVELHLLSSASRTLATAVESERLIHELLQSLCEAGRWAVGIYWVVDPLSDRLLCDVICHAPLIDISRFRLRTQDLKLARGSEIPGRAWESCKAVWVADLDDGDPSFRALKATSDGLLSAVGFPILINGAVEGVIELFADEKRAESEGAMRAFSVIGDQTGQALQRIRAEAEVRASARRYQAITEMAKDAVVIVDGESTILSANKAMEDVFGYSQDELVGMPLTMLMPEGMRHAHLAGMKRYAATRKRRMQWESLELPGLHKSGEEMLLEISLADISHDHETIFAGYVRDITARKREESALVYQALHDSLTDLPNRNLLQERLNRAVLVARRHNAQLALLFMDLDRFKDVNDTFGHHCGDQLLQQVAKRISYTLRESDTVARLGGDEFAMLLPNTGESGATLTAQRIMEALSQDFALEGHQFDIGASVGIAFFPDHGGDAATLMRRADAAMYAAKRSTGGYIVYAPERDENNSLRLLMTGELRTGIESDQLLLHYQPKVNLQTGVADNVEALIRWEHPQRGLTSPDYFIPLAEQTGLMRPLTEWVLGEALRQYKEWLKIGFDIRVAVNFSARVLHDPGLVEMVIGTLEKWEVEPSRLEVEITESAIMADPDSAKETVKALHKAGIWLSIDDFGTGYSSLAYLKNLSVDEIKIDKSFVMEMATNRDDESIVRSVVTLGHNFGLQVVAEGVDNKRTLDKLTEMGCDLAQGYFLSRPIAGAAVPGWLESQHGRTQLSIVS